MGIVHRKTSVMSTAEEIELRESMDDDRANLLGDKTSSSTNKRLLSWRELPEWMKDNIYITAGYRKPTGSYIRSLYSLFYIHNESGKWKHDATLDLQLTHDLDSQYMESFAWFLVIHWIGHSLFVDTAICR